VPSLGLLRTPQGLVYWILPVEFPSLTTVENSCAAENSLVMAFYIAEIEIFLLFHKQHG